MAFHSFFAKCVCKETNWAHDDGLLVKRPSLAHGIKWSTSNNEFPSFLTVRHCVTEPTKSMALLSLFSIKLSSTIDLCFQFPSDTRCCVHPPPLPPAQLNISISAVENYERAELPTRLFHDRLSFLQHRLK